MVQAVINGTDMYRKIGEYLKERQSKKFLLVCGGSFEKLGLRAKFDALQIPFVFFREFAPNPVYEDVCAGVKRFLDEGCDAIVAVGGGSAIDVAKCIKLYAYADPSVSYLEQEHKDSGIPLVAVPTTAGTGSEATRFAVIYLDGVKQSVAHDSILPDFVVLDSPLLNSLPLYQKKCTLLDALCQAIESWWSVHSTPLSREFAATAIRMIMAHHEAYLGRGDAEATKEIMLAANFAGRAINLTKTTAPHAMGYKLTTLYHLPHGHSVALCLPRVWEYMLQNPDRCSDRRGSDYLLQTLADIARAFHPQNPDAAVEAFDRMLGEWGIEGPVATDRDAEIKMLTASVNPQRLQFNPVSLDSEAISEIYKKIVQ